MRQNVAFSLVSLQELIGSRSAAAWTTPSCIFTPITIDELSAAVLTAQKTQCQFAVRSGGHSPFHGFAGIDQGLLISTAGFKDLQYSNATQVQRSGMGSTLR